MARSLLVLALAGLLVLGGCGGGDGGDDGLTGSGKDDQLAGTDGADKIQGGAGKDTVEAKAGDDEIDGGADEDFLFGGDGDDRFLESEDDAVDVHDCGPGDDLVAEPDTRDELLPNCENAGWTGKPPSEDPFENRLSVAPTLTAGRVEFEGECPEGCTGEIELRTPRDRVLLGKGRLQLAAGEPGPVTAKLNKEGDELLARGGYVRIVLRAGGINSGFTTFLSTSGGHSQNGM